MEISKKLLNWKIDLLKRFWIEETFHASTFDKNLYDATLQTMRYISRYIVFDKSLKNDLHELRQYYLTNKEQ